MANEITDLKQLEKLVTGEKIPFFISSLGKPTGIKFDYSYCWTDEYKGKSLRIFARGADSEHILAYITRLEWFEIVGGSELIMKPPELPLNRSFGYSYTPEEKEEFAILYRAITCKAPTSTEIEFFRRGRLYNSFFGE